ncbi:LacI family DNA-binding transcriptional regulator [Pseudoalteromonas denitrificans]|nr:LacI family DNA-binding transcriptional regulator [Pseudoalteromonas denitrificans]
MKVTINDVAKLASVSIKTVSRVINNEPSVRKATFDKVMEAVKTLNYQPNLAARNLAGSKSFTIGLVYDNPNAYYVLDMQNGILSCCKSEGYELLIHPCSYAKDDMIEELKTMINRARISGLVLTPPLSEINEVIDMLDEQNIHYVRILSGQELDPAQTECIYVNDHNAAFQITEHLISQGHKSIAFLKGDKGHKSTRERLSGYKESLVSNNIKVDESLILEGEYSFSSGVENAKKIINQDKSVTAIIACNDEIAAGALFAARLMDIKIPDELSISGFENSPFSRQTWPKLTTANQSIETIAQNAAKLLFSKTRGQRNKDKEIIKTFTPELVIRDSTGPI